VNIYADEEIDWNETDEYYLMDIDEIHYMGYSMQEGWFEMSYYRYPEKTGFYYYYDDSEEQE